MKKPSLLIVPNKEGRTFTPEEEEQKRLFYEKMSPRRRKFIDKIGYEVWDPFEGPKEPLDIRVDGTKRTTQQLVREFLQSMGDEQHSNEYARGALDCALGIVAKEDKYQGIFDFCIWYYDLLKKEQSRS